MNLSQIKQMKIGHELLIARSATAIPASHDRVDMGCRAHLRVLSYFVSKNSARQGPALWKPMTVMLRMQSLLMRHQSHSLDSSPASEALPPNPRQGAALYLHKEVLPPCESFGRRVTLHPTRGPVPVTPGGASPLHPTAPEHI